MAMSVGSRYGGSRYQVCHKLSMPGCPMVSCVDHLGQIFPMLCRPCFDFLPCYFISVKGLLFFVSQFLLLFNRIKGFSQPVHFQALFILHSFRFNLRGYRALVCFSLRFYIPLEHDIFMNSFLFRHSFVRDFHMTAFKGNAFAFSAKSVEIVSQNNLRSLFGHHLDRSEGCSRIRIVRGRLLLCTLGTKQK